MRTDAKPLVWAHGEVKSPPFSAKARLEAGKMLRRIQMGETLSMPHSRPMPGIGPGCHELRIVDRSRSWRIVYCIRPEAIVIAEVFPKTTQTTPVIIACKRRLRA